MTNANGVITQPLKLRFDSGPAAIDLLTLDSVDSAVGNGSGINFTNSTNNAEGSFLVLGRIRATRPDELTVRLDLMVNPALSSDNARPVLSLLGGKDAAGNILTDRVSLAGSLSVTDATSLGGFLNVAGATTLSGTLSASGATTLGGTLRVAGAATLNSSLAVAGPATLNSSLAVAGAATLNSSLNVAGPTALGGTLRVAGAVGIGTTAPQRPLHVEGHEIHSGGPVAGFSFGNRGSAFVDGGNAGERWVLYSHERVARLWTGGDQYFFTPQGEFGRRGGSSVLHLWGSQLMDVGDGRLRIRSGGGTVSFDGNDNVAIGFNDPRNQLHVLRGIATGLDFTSAGSITFYPPDGFAWFHIDNGPAGGRNMGVLRISHGGSPGANLLMQIAQNGDVFVPGRLIAPRKAGFVVDQFVNNLGVSLETGDVVVVGADQSTLYFPDAGLVPAPEVDRAEQAYDTRVCGIVLEPYAAGRSDVLGGEGAAPPEVFEPGRGAVEPGQIGLMVTLGCTASCKVDADIAPIQPGDLLTTSSTPGHAQKVLDRAQATGAILGKALGALDKGRGVIPVFVSCQ